MDWIKNLGIYLGIPAGILLITLRLISLFEKARNERRKKEEERLKNSGIHIPTPVEKTKYSRPPNNKELTDYLSDIGLAMIALFSFGSSRSEASELKSNSRRTSGEDDDFFLLQIPLEIRIEIEEFQNDPKSFRDRKRREILLVVAKDNFESLAKYSLTDDFPAEVETEASKQLHEIEWVIRANGKDRALRAQQAHLERKIRISELARSYNATPFSRTKRKNIGQTTEIWDEDFFAEKLVTKAVGLLHELQLNIKSIGNQRAKEFLTHLVKSAVYDKISIDVDSSLVTLYYLSLGRLKRIKIAPAEKLNELSDVYIMSTHGISQFEIGVDLDRATRRAMLRFGDQRLSFLASKIDAKSKSLLPTLHSIRKIVKRRRKRK